MINAFVSYTKILPHSRYYQQHVLVWTNPDQNGRYFDENSASIKIRKVTSGLYLIKSLTR